jgi:LmbE family N-acetylglucosaminyl deacetylase
MKLDVDFQPERVLCVAAHPDDLEFSVAGSVAKWAAAGAEVYYLICTDGGKGTADRSLTGQAIVETRRQEQRKAAEILGVKDVTFLDYEDGATDVCMELKRDIAREIRRHRPDAVFCFDPTMLYSADYGFINHPDHRAVGQATIEAVYPLARDHLTFPQLLEEGFEPHKTPVLLLMNLDKGNFAVDISETFVTKLEALAAHKSQIADMYNAEQYIHDLAETCGAKVGCALAESFMRVDIR